MTRELIDLTGLWRFQPDLYRQGEPCGWYQAGFETRFWREVSVPCTFEQAYPDLANYEGAGWFVRTFSVPENWKTRRAVLRLGAVSARAKVWVNGEFVGDIPDSYLPIDLPVCDFIRHGRENTLAVQVDNRRVAGEVPGTEYGWRPFGGILRNVDLVATHPLWIQHIATTAESDGSFRQVIEVSSRCKSAADAAVAVSVKDSAGTAVATFTAGPCRVAPGETKTLEIVEQVPSVHAWSPQSPVRYQAEVTASADGSVVDSQSLRIGFRSVHTEGTTLRLNDEPIFLKGFNRHEDSPTANGCWDPQTVRADLEAMKSIGCNFIRMCHYPHDPREIDLCDELGLLVMCEIPLYWCSGYSGTEPTVELSRAAARRQLTTMIRRDGNHPSVIFWSVSNETEESNPPVVELNTELVALARELDDSRLAVHVSNHWRSEPHFDTDDVVCVNDYPTWWQLARGQHTEPDYALSTKTWQDSLRELQAQYPDKPILVTEFGGLSLRGVHGGALGEEVHAGAIAAEFAGIEAAKACGATLWCWADHLWPYNTWMSNLHFSPFGVMTRQRQAKSALWAARKAFGPPSPPPAPEKTPPPAQSAPPGLWHGDSVNMVCPALDAAAIPQFSVPDGCTLRGMRPNEEALWTDIWRDADRYLNVGDTVFTNEFGSDPGAWSRRVLLLFNEKNVAVGTLGAWYDRNFLGEDYGRIHWFAIRREYQGKGLARPMMTEAMNRLAKWHSRATLGTQIKRLSAIKLYLDYGFRPLIQSDADRKSWDQVRNNLKHPLLDDPIVRT